MNTRFSDRQQTNFQQNSSEPDFFDHVISNENSLNYFDFIQLHPEQMLNTTNLIQPMNNVSGANSQYYPIVTSNYSQMTSNPVVFPSYNDTYNFCNLSANQCPGLNPYTIQVQMPSMTALQDNTSFLPILNEPEKSLDSNVKRNIEQVERNKRYYVKDGNKSIRGYAIKGRRYIDANTLEPVKKKDIQEDCAVTKEGDVFVKGMLVTRQKGEYENLIQLRGEEKLISLKDLSKCLYFYANTTDIVSKKDILKYSTVSNEGDLFVKGKPVVQQKNRVFYLRGEKPIKPQTLARRKYTYAGTTEEVLQRDILMRSTVSDEGDLFVNGRPVVRVIKTKSLVRYKDMPTIDPNTNTKITRYSVVKLRGGATITWDAICKRTYAYADDINTVIPKEYFKQYATITVEGDVLVNGRAVVWTKPLVNKRPTVRKYSYPTYTPLLNTTLINEAAPSQKNLNDEPVDSTVANQNYSINVTSIGVENQTENNTNRGMPLGSIYDSSNVTTLFSQKRKATESLGLKRNERKNFSNVNNQY